MHTRALGGQNEQLVAQHLLRSGYTLLDANAACRLGEVDLIAERDGILCFVEVRSRSTSVWGDPSQTVTVAKQRKIVKAAMQWLQRHRAFERMIRFDVASVVGRGDAAVVEYLPNAFDAGF